MRTKTERLISCRQAMSATEVRRGGERVLTELYSTALSRVEEIMFRDHLVPMGDAIVRVTVERWCDTQEDPTEEP